MRDYDATVKNLREAAKGLLFDAMPYRASVMKDAADAIEELIARDVVPMDFHERCLQLEIKKRIELEKQLPQWISVEERLPETAYRVLTCSGEYVTENMMCTTIDVEGKHLVWAFRDGLVTHWMPLPLPPKGDV